MNIVIFVEQMGNLFQVTKQAAEIDNAPCPYKASAVHFHSFGD